MKDQAIKFLEARRKFALELIFWVGLIALVGFIRVNWFGASLELNTAQYITYSIAGTEISRETDVEKTIEMNKGDRKNGKIKQSK